MGKSDRNKQIGRTKLRWKDVIKIDLQEVKLGHGLVCSGSG